MVENDGASGTGLGVVLAPLLLACCSEPTVNAVPAQPEGWSGELALPRAVDLSADPNVLEINLEARVANVELTPGKPTAMWTYEGGLPGPLIRAKVGDL